MGESVYLCESIFMTFWVNTIHQCGEVRWFYNERGGPYECRKTHTYAVCMCVCVSPHLLPLSPTLSCLVHFTPLTGSGSSSTTEQRHTTAPNPVAAHRHIWEPDEDMWPGAKGVKHGEERKKIFTRFDLQLKWKLKISVDWTIKEQVCLKMTEQLHSVIVGCFFFSIECF